MANKKVTITKRMLEKSGVVKFAHTDSYGITYEMKAFRMGYGLHGRVLTEEGRLVFHNELSFDSFDSLKLCFERTAATMLNEQHCIHIKYSEAAKELADKDELSMAERMRQAFLILKAS